MSVDTHARLISILCDYTNILSTDINPQSHLVFDLGMDSLEMIAVMTAIENEFGVRIPDDIAASAGTVGELEKFIEDRLSVKEDVK